VHVVFAGVYLHRLPVKHTDASIDQRFQALASWFYGRVGGNLGNLCCTWEEFREGMVEACRKSAHAASMTYGGPMQLMELDAVWNWKAALEPHFTGGFGGWGHQKKMFTDPKTGLHWEGRKGSHVHFVHFFLVDGVAYLRYMTAACSGVWHPDGADGVSAVGIKPFGDKKVRTWFTRARNTQAC
jgi:hypothetical protein